MLTIEMKVNGTIIGQMYAHNKGYIDDGFDLCEYDYNCYLLNEGHNAELCTGVVTHKRSEGFAELSRVLFEHAAANLK